MKLSADQFIERFAHLTHSPRGQYAASEETYRQLLDRLPDYDRPRTEISTAAYTHTTAHRWSTAASVALIVGIGLAIAGVYTFRDEIFTGRETAPAGSPDIEMRTGRTLVFDNQPLAEIIGTLSETYDINIEIKDSELASFCITATFSTDEPLDEVLTILAEVGRFSYEETDSGYVIYKDLQ